ncbi:hypothetical protein HMPREF1981_00892 [Bacteroides pyogenes F0041]|uniref:Uncharacterized protein n=1 Tax=Bacteroides pyogenes F0041 TaxID=1321819 RepID=U2DXV0_9BACE|nr:hypothetical protein HMPREF1981_00892 [Bacteroides pyogenes F0041]
MTRRESRQALREIPYNKESVARKEIIFSSGLRFQSISGP